MMSNDWIPSRYTRSLRIGDKGRILYNTYSGAIAVVLPGEEEEVRSLLDNGEQTAELSGLVNELGDAGFLVPAGTDELMQAQQLHDAFNEARSMHLVIMPTEACNYRCTYCYQTFPRGAMARQTIEGLKTYMSQTIHRIDHLAVSWFGGEPLLAFDIIMELSDHFLACCALNGVGYSADMSTNGYFLSRERFVALLDRNINRFMVTLDGVDAVHDRRRKLRAGEGSYEMIIGNLKELLSVDTPFTIDIRVNFDEDNAAEVPDLLKELSELFGGDRRFQLLIRPVGRWGGPQDDLIPVCDRTAADTHLWKLTEHGLEQGLALSETIADGLMPSGSVCYAAKPNSLVIGANGQLYKCSIALDDEINQVGQLHEDGSIDIDMDKVSLWTGSGEEKDSVCRSCYYRPVCQGNHCPLYRMRTGKRPCPHEKRKIKQVLNLLWMNAEQSEGGETEDEVDSIANLSCSSVEIK